MREPLKSRKALQAKQGATAGTLVVRAAQLGQDAVLPRDADQPGDIASLAHGQTMLLYLAVCV